jgi:hypothetical protein
VTVERSRPLVVPRTGSPEEQSAERTYREEEVAAILHRAAQLDLDPGVPEGGLNLREIEAIARDSGIDLSLVRQAARELDDDGQGIAAAIAGAPLRRTIERVVDVEIGADLHERLAQEIREVLSAPGATHRRILPGSVSSIGRSLILTGFVGTSAIEVNVAPRDGKTLIRISADRSQLAGGLFGGIVGGIGGGAGANVGWMIPTLVHLPWYAGLVGAGMVVVGAYALARTIFASTSRGVDGQLNALADRLEAVAASGTHPASLPSSAG